MSNTLFSYNNKTSPLHKIPALVKILFTCLFCFFVFADFSSFSNPKTTLFHVKINFNTLKMLISGIIALLLWFFSKSGIKSFFRLKAVLFIGLLFTVFKGLSLKSPFFNFQLAKEGLVYGYNFFISTFVAVLLFETTTMLEIQNDLRKIPLIKKTNFPIILSITISFFPEIFTTWKEVSLAAKARNKNSSKSIIKKIKSLVAELSALFSCMLQKAEIKRKALLSRKNYN